MRGRGQFLAPTLVGWQSRAWSYGEREEVHIAWGRKWVLVCELYRASITSKWSIQTNSGRKKSSELEIKHENHQRVNVKEGWDKKSKLVVVVQLLRCIGLCDPIDCSPPGSSVYGISQAGILEWVAISFSRGYSWPSDRTCIFCIARLLRRKEEGRGKTRFKRWRDTNYYA